MAKDPAELPLRSSGLPSRRELRHARPPSRGSRASTATAAVLGTIATVRERAVLVVATSLLAALMLAGLSPAAPEPLPFLATAVPGELPALEYTSTEAPPSAGMMLIAHQQPAKTPRQDPFAGGQDETSETGGQDETGGTDETANDDVCVSLPIEQGRFRITSPYGYRTHPIFGGQLMHTGTDYAAPLGTPIHAITDGVVVYTGGGRLGRSSELVIIEHEIDDQTFYSWYVHMYPDGVFVTVGERVMAGETIAEVGSNGNSTGPHVHLEIHTSDAGLGLTKSAPTLSDASFVTARSPTADPEDPDPAPGERRITDGRKPATEADEDNQEDEDERDGEPSDEPSEEPSETPSDEPSPSETPSPEPSETPSDEPSPSETPSPEPSETPSDDPSPSETPSPEPSKTPTPSPSTSEPAPTPSTSEPAPTPSTSEPAPTPTEERSSSSPFPTRAYGTTVDPVHFLASLGFTMVGPSHCLARD